MSKIRADFVGVIHLPDHGLVLKAGDDIPKGVVIGEHALDPDSVPAGDGWAAKTVEELKAEIASRNEGREEAQYIVPDGKGNKPDLVAALEADDAAAAQAGE